MCRAKVSDGIIKRVQDSRLSSLVFHMYKTTGMINVEHVTVVCPACGHQVQAVATEGRVKGYCAIARQYVNFPVETRDTVETETEVAAAPASEGEGRDNKGRFVKGNMPWNKKGQPADTNSKSSSRPASMRDSKGRFIKGQ